MAIEQLGGMFNGKRISAEEVRGLTSGSVAGIFSKFGFASPKDQANAVVRSGKFGYGPDSIPATQLVKIASAQLGSTVLLALQDKVSLNTEGLWGSISEVADGSPYADMANVLTQMLTGGRYSLVDEYTSRRYWKGTTPIKLTLPLKLDAEDDPDIEIMAALKTLQKMVAPSKVGFGFLAPPGPSPFRTDEYKKGVSDEIKAVLDGSDTITITIGDGFLHFDSVIIKNINIDIYNMFTESGKPIAADVLVEFQTYAVNSKQELDAIFNGMPYVTMDSALTNTVKGVAKKLTDFIPQGVKDTVDKAKNLLTTNETINKSSDLITNVMAGIDQTKSFTGS